MSCGAFFPPAPCLDHRFCFWLCIVSIPASVSSLTQRLFTRDFEFLFKSARLNLQPLLVSRRVLVEIAAFLLLRPSSAGNISACRRRYLSIRGKQFFASFRSQKEPMGSGHVLGAESGRAPVQVSTAGRAESHCEVAAEHVQRVTPPPPPSSCVVHCTLTFIRLQYHKASVSPTSWSRN